METARDAPALRARIGAWRAAGERVALVPTMGALHDGHLSLIRIARAGARRVIASLFVNPAQFAADEDLDRYPRREAADADLLRQAGCDLLFAPSVAQVYPPGFATQVHVRALDGVLEGKSRPGHFDGVATVVTKLLLMALPDVAVFGEKDWQQLAIIRRLVDDLNIPVEVLGAPIVREPDGLAMSSRNAYLDSGQRTLASVLPGTMRAAVTALGRGSPPAETLAAARAALGSAGFELDYLELAHEETLQPLPASAPGARLFVATRLGSTRLIDNMAVPAAAQ